MDGVGRFLLVQSLRVYSRCICGVESKANVDTFLFMI